MTQKNDIECLLVIWAEWEIALMKGEIGWPKSSILYAVKDGGSRPEFGPKVPYQNEIAERMRFIIDRELMKYNQPDGEIWAEALKATMIFPGPFKAPSEIADQLGISKRTLQERCRAAKIWLSGRATYDPILNRKEVSNG